jgi:paraquat-inducible protein B
MRRLPLSTTVGLFILGGVVAFAIAILLFSSGFQWGMGHNFVLYFNESVNGLNVGAPVKLRGVQVGQVRKITVQFDPIKRRVSVPVVIALDKAYFSLRHQEENTHLLTNVGHPVAESPLVLGLVGALQTESFVTGQLFIELNYEALDARHYLTLSSDGLPEIPTRSSNLQNIGGQVLTIVEGLSSIDYASIGSSIREIASHLAGVPFASISKNLDTNVTSALTAFSETCRQMGALAGQAAKIMDPTADNFKVAALEFAESMRYLRLLFGDGSSLRIGLDRCMHNLGSAATVMRLFFEFLERNPDALLRGKYNGERP